MVVVVQEASRPAQMPEQEQTHTLVVVVVVLAGPQAIRLSG